MAAGKDRLPRAATGQHLQAGQIGMEPSGALRVEMGREPCGVSGVKVWESEPDGGVTDREETL